jgi:hypothetical protein
VFVTIANNLMDKLEKLIFTIRNIKEEMVASVPTNSANSAGLGFNPDTESPPVDLRKKRRWNIFFKDMVRRQRKREK